MAILSNMAIFFLLISVVLYNNGNKKGDDLLAVCELGVLVNVGSSLFLCSFTLNQFHPC